MNFNHSGAKYTTNNNIKVYVNGEDKFKQLIEDIKNAKRYIHIEYYIFKNDMLGKDDNKRTNKESRKMD